MNPQGDENLVLHSINQTIETILMKCPGSCTPVNSNQFCFSPPLQLCRILFLAVSTETEMK